MVSERAEQVVSLIGGRLNFTLLSGRVISVNDGDPPSNGIAVWRLDVTRNQADERVSDDGVLYIGALGILLLIDCVANRGAPAKSGREIFSRLLKLFPGSADASAMIKASVSAALGHGGNGGEHDYFTACALRQIQDWCTDNVDVEVSGLPNVALH